VTNPNKILINLQEARLSSLELRQITTPTRSPAAIRTPRFHPKISRDKKYFYFTINVLRDKGEGGGGRGKTFQTQFNQQIKKHAKSN
jgi:hypothetical protein